MTSSKISLKTKEKSNLKKRMILKSLRWPVFYFFIGMIFELIGIFKFNSIFINHGKLFDYTDTVGYIFIELAGIMFIYKLLSFIFIYYEQVYKKTNFILSMIYRSLRRNLKVVFIIITFSIIITTFTALLNLSFYTSNIISISVILSLGWIAVRSLHTIEFIIRKKIQLLQYQEKIKIYPLYTKMRVINNTGAIIVIVLTIAGILMTFNNLRQLGISLLASAGIVTAIIGLSGKKTFSSILTSLQIVFSQAVKIGDTLYIEKNWGIVEEISYTYIQLKMKDKRRMLVPLSYFLENQFENWTKEDNSLTVSIHFRVDYMMPIDLLREHLAKILNESEYWDGITKKILINKLDDSSVEVRVQVSTTNAETLSHFKSQLREGFLNLLREDYPHYLPKSRQIGISDLD